MAKYTIESDYCSVFGMDVHARSITVKGWDLSTGKSRTKKFGDCPTAETLLEWMVSQFTAPYHAAYELLYFCLKEGLPFDVRAELPPVVEAFAGALKA